MAFNERRRESMVFPYAPDDVFAALQRALASARGYACKGVNPVARTVAVQTGVSWKSWGETIMVQVVPAANGLAEVRISSASQFGVISWGKNEENLARIRSLLAEQLAADGYPLVQGAQG